MDRLEEGVYQPVTCTVSSILREYLAKLTPAKKSFSSVTRHSPSAKDKYNDYNN